MTSLGQTGEPCAQVASVSARTLEVPFRPLTTAQMIGWMLGAAVSFHLAYEFFPPLIVLFLVCMFRLAHARTRPLAMYAGWLLGLLIYGPQLTFFWKIFGAGASALWMVLATWLGIFLVLQRFALLKLGPQFGALAAPFLWTGVEYFRSELYYLRFSWLNVGYTFSNFPRAALVPWLGMYGIGFVLMLAAACAPFRGGASRRHKWIWILGTGALCLSAYLPGRHDRLASAVVPGGLRVAGVQLEFAEEEVVVAELDKLLAKSPQTELFVLSEYTFAGPVPAAVKNWCARNHKYLVAGGKDFVGATKSDFRNTAFVIGPDGQNIFAQAKKVPIQLFKDGLPAVEQRVWDSPWGKLGLCVCYDLSYTRVTDGLIGRGAQAIIVPTMDVEEWGERQHHLHSRVAPVRAAEYGVPIFRLCSSGISQAVDARGMVLGTAPFPGQTKTLEAVLRLPTRGTLPLDRVLVWPCVGVSVSLFAWAILCSFRSSRK